MRTTALLAEDEAPQRRELVSLLAELWPELRLVAECEDGTSALEALETHHPQIVFLDIRMPGMTGLEVARAAGDTAHIVFITAHDEFAVQAFEQGAADYLLKPVRRERLAATVERLKLKLRDGVQPDAQQRLAALEEQIAARRTPGIRWITTSVGNSMRVIAIDDVLFFQAQDKYTCVATAAGEAHIRTPLKDLLDQLDPAQFWQIHRGTIVRVGAIRAIERDEDGKFKVLVQGRADALPVSAAFQYRFRSM